MVVLQRMASVMEMMERFAAGYQSLGAWRAHPALRHGTAPRPMESKSVGHVYAGADFYVWDEDEHLALDWARELAGPRAAQLRQGRWR